MIVNIVDHRTNHFNTLCNVRIEPACHNNAMKNATKYIDDCGYFYCHDFRLISIVQAIEHGNNLDGSFTLNVYDPL